MELSGARGRAPTVLGLDEAGRGSLIGPLVVGGFVVPRRRVEELTSLGARDSKLLSPRRRTEVYGRLLSVGRCISEALPPSTIDRYVERGRLNDLEAEAFARLVHAIEPGETFLDACDPVASRFGETVRRLSGTAAHVRASHGADRIFPVVGAASIVAKVRRDHAITLLADRLGDEIGSGYPSDARTIRYVRKTLRAGGRRPSWLRMSWRTTQRLIGESQARVLEGFSG